MIAFLKRTFAEQQTLKLLHVLDICSENLAKIKLMFDEFILGTLSAASVIPKINRVMQYGW
jgi:hypothetical protein